jgi:rhodanese-related sulfurtransferase
LAPWRFKWVFLGLCLLAPAIQAAPASEPPTVIAREAALLVDPEAVAVTLGTPAAPTLIDIRPGAEQASVTIPGALPIPLHALKTKPYLRDRELVLVGQGHEYRAVAQTIQMLRQQGFKKVRMLDGGLNRWRRLGLPLTGDTFAQEALQRLTPQAYLREQGVDQWVVLSLGSTCQDLPTRLQTVLEARQGAGQAAVLLVGPDGEDYAPALQALAGQPGLNLFVLQGGQLALQSERARSQAIAGTRHRLASTERPLACR